MRRDETLFIDARKLGHMLDRTRRDLSEEDISRVAGTYYAWLGREDNGEYADVPGFCKSASLDERFGSMGTYSLPVVTWG